MTEPRSWSPRPAVVGVAWALAAAALLTALLSAEPTTRLLLGTATAFLAALAAYGTFLRPKLAVDDTGLTVRTVTGPRHLPWHEVKVKLAHTRRLGREMTTLELDWERGEDEQLYVLTITDLGADPRDVADVLHALRP
ncbi:PH domain-containing protein [Actinosynnema sp. NPDC047251]|uniref:PH domain-containing protein n=1 Tax=Saccharothrix espanaensis TaxID=103731 RepID=UPI0002EC56E1|nr:PH domain-containing protein [Saccharothrix espanaensis]